MDHFVHGLFRDEESAARAVKALTEAHFDPEQISGLMRVGTHLRDSPAVYEPALGRGALLGSVLGAAGAVALATSGFLVAGPLVALGGGGAVGALSGALAGLGRWTAEIDFPAHPPGMILVGVDTDESQFERARAALASARPERIHVSRKGEACEEVETGVLSDSGVLVEPE